MKLSIVTSLYRSANYINEFYKRMKGAAEIVTDDYEIIFVNDGSPDDSLAIARELFKRDNKIKILDLSRNYGHHKAISTGLAYTQGELIFTIDCDLEESPEVLPEFYQQLKSGDDLDYIYSVQKERQGHLAKKLGGAIFYKLFNYLADIKIHPNLGTSRLMTKRFVQNILRYKDRDPFLAGIYMLAGFKGQPLVIDKPYKGATSYTFRKRVEFFMRAILSFSSKPLVYVFNLGVLISLVSFSLIIYLIIKSMFFHDIVEGWTSIMVSIWFVGGVIISALGIIGLYIAKIFEEVKDRPLTVIKDVYSH